jgi:mRNA-degrading endonuclease toxin of MazEF toxin-antitoxin module
MEKINTFPKFGEIWQIHFDKSSENKKEIRPCLIISNNFKNELDEEIVIVPITSQGLNSVKKFEVFIENNSSNGLDKPSKILFDSPRTVNKHLRLKKLLGKIDKEILQQVIKAWQFAFNTDFWVV